MFMVGVLALLVLYIRRNVPESLRSGGRRQKQTASGSARC
jgi:hypothetical protein